MTKFRKEYDEGTFRLSEHAYFICLSWSQESVYMYINRISRLLTCKFYCFRNVFVGILELHINLSMYHIKHHSLHVLDHLTDF